MNIKKLTLCVVLCIIMVAGLFLFDEGLFSTFRQQDLYGSWLTTVPAAERVEQSLKQFGITCDIEDSLQMTYEFCFKEDCTVSVCVEKESARELAAVQVEALRQGLPELLYTQYQTEGNMTREEVDAMLTAQGLTMESLVDISLGQIDFEAQYASEAMTIVQYYCVENGKICYAPNPDSLTAGNYEMTVEPAIRGDTLVLSNATDSEGNPFSGSGVVKYPLTLIKK